MAALFLFLGGSELSFPAYFEETDLAVTEQLITRFRLDNLIVQTAEALIANPLLVAVVPDRVIRLCWYPSKAVDHQQVAT
ncbi:hypothetical protein [Yoonia sp. MH D7]